MLALALENCFITSECFAFGRAYDNELFNFKQNVNEN